MNARRGTPAGAPTRAEAASSPPDPPGSIGQLIASDALAVLLDELACGLLVTDGATDRVVACNGRAQGWFGSVVGESAWALLDPTGTPPCERCAAAPPSPELGQLGEPHVHELRSARTSHWYRCTVRGLRSRDGGPHWLIAAEDITERKLAELALRQQRDLLEPFVRAQSRQLAAVPMSELLAGLLDDVVALTGSTCGFVGEVFEALDAPPVLFMHAIRGAAPDGAGPLACGSDAHGPVPCEEATPFGAVALGRETILSNDAGRDPRLAKRPAGHPPIETFLGLPLFGRGELVGVIAVANRPGGYDEEQLTLLEPLCAGCGGLILAHRAREQATTAEAQLRESNQFLGDVLGTLRDPLFVVDPADWSIVWGGPSNDVGDTAVGQRCHELLHGSDTPCAREDCPVQQVVRTGQAVSANHVHQDAMGGDRSVHVDAYPLLAPSGQISRVLVCARDETDHRALLDRVAQHQQLDVLGRLAGGVAHELGNVLSILLGYTELALRELPFDEPGRDHVVQVERSAHRAEAFSRQLLAFGRRQQLELVPTSLSEQVEHLAEVLVRLIGEDVEVTLELEPGLPNVMADAAQLDRVVLNLAVAARDTMPDGGRLALRTDTAQLGEQEAALRVGARPGRYALLEVSDTGRGMPPETLARLFEPYGGGGAAGSNFGLGMAEVYGIVAQHGGHIDVESRIGLGSVFRIYLPLVEERDEVEEQGAWPPSGRGEAEPNSWRRWFGTVLVVDDDEAIRRLAADILEPLGYRVLVAGTGEEALATARGFVRPIDVVLVDLVMPKMSGAEVVRRLAQLRTESLFLFMSGHPDAEIPTLDIDPDRVAFLPKPLTPTRLLDKLAQLAQKRAERAR